VFTFCVAYKVAACGRLTRVIYRLFRLCQTVSRLNSHHLIRHVAMTTSRRFSRHFIGFQFVGECSLRRRCWYGSVCTTQRQVTWPTSVCRRRLRTVVASLALQSPGPSWCPGLGRLLASAALLRLAPGPGTDYQRPSDHQNCRSLHSCASSRPTRLFEH